MLFVVDPVLLPLELELELELELPELDVPVIVPDPLTGIVVAWSITTIVVPSITVVRPEIEYEGLTGTVVGPVMINSVIPS